MILLTLQLIGFLTLLFSERTLTCKNLALRAVGFLRVSVRTEHERSALNLSVQRMGKRGKRTKLIDENGGENTTKKYIFRKEM